MIKPADFVAAITPPVATVTAGQINSLLGIATGGVMPATKSPGLII